MPQQRTLRAIGTTIVALALAGCFGEPDPGSDAGGDDAAASSTAMPGSEGSASPTSTGAPVSTGAADSTGVGGSGSEGGNVPDGVIKIYATSEIYDGDLVAIDETMALVDIVDVECALAIDFTLNECETARAIIKLPGFSLESALDTDLPIYATNGAFLSDDVAGFFVSPQQSLVSAGVLGEGEPLFWTGAGGPDAADCGGWTNGGDGSGVAGDGTKQSATWVAAGGDQPCSVPLPLLCACW